MPNLTGGGHAYGGGAGPGVLAVLAGRMLCDTYLAARDLVKEVDYTLKTLARSLLNQERHELSATDLPGDSHLTRPREDFETPPQSSKVKLLTDANTIRQSWTMDLISRAFSLESTHNIAVQILASMRVIGSSVRSRRIAYQSIVC